jgi:hypothetical protein
LCLSTERLPSTSPTRCSATFRADIFGSSNISLTIVLRVCCHVYGVTVDRVGIGKWTF